MTDEKILLNLSVYQERLKEWKISSRQFPATTLFPNRAEALAHCQAMIEKVPIFLQEGQKDKVNRLFGFIQACLWQNGVFSISDLEKN